jgi:hypothetical protein
MSRIGLRSFSAGVIMTTSILGVIYYNDDKSNLTFDTKQLENVLHEQGQVAINQAEYDQLLQIRDSYNEYKENQQKENKEETNKEVIIEEKIITKYILEIKQGMNSMQISRQLENVGIINSANDLHSEITAKNLSSSVQIGTFQLTSDMTIDEIIKKITK